MASHEVDHTASATRRVFQSMPQVRSARINLARNDQTTHSKVRMWTWHPGTLFCHTSLEKLLNTGDPTGTRTPNRLLRRQMLYPVELWDHAVARWRRVVGAKMWRFGHTRPCKAQKKRAASLQPLSLGSAEVNAISGRWKDLRSCCRLSSCSSWTSCRQHQRLHPWSSIRLKKTCCKTRLCRP